MWRVIWSEFTPYNDSVTNDSLESYDWVGWLYVKCIHLRVEYGCICDLPSAPQASWPVLVWANLTWVNMQHITSIIHEHQQDKTRFFEGTWAVLGNDSTDIMFLAHQIDTTLLQGILCRISHYILQPWQNASTNFPTYHASILSVWVLVE